MMTLFNFFIAIVYICYFIEDLIHGFRKFNLILTQNSPLKSPRTMIARTMIKLML